MSQTQPLPNSGKAKKVKLHSGKAKKVKLPKRNDVLRTQQFRAGEAKWFDDTTHGKILDGAVACLGTGTRKCVIVLTGKGDF